MPKIIVSITCPITKHALYVSEVKPSLLKRHVLGDWGYTSKSANAIELTVRQANIAVKDMKLSGLNPQIITT